MRISVVIPTYNRLASLRRVLAGLAQQSFPVDEYEVVVISDGSTDGTDEYLRSETVPFRLVPLRQPNGGPAAARNHGVEKARGEIVLFMDDDVVPSPQLVAEHVRVHCRHGGNVAVLGPMLSPPDYQMSPWVRWEQEMLVKEYRDMTAGKWEPTARQFYTGNTSLARRHVVEAGGFDSSLRRAEDVELGYRLARRGLCFAFNPKAVGWHYAERSLESWQRAAYAYGRNDVVFSRDRGHNWLMPVVLGELRRRHLLLRCLTRACLDHETWSQFALVVLGKVIGMGKATNLRGLQHIACSGIFSLRYCQGIAEGLGGRRAFYRELSRSGLPSSAVQPRS